MSFSPDSSALAGCGEPLCRQKPRIWPEPCRQTREPSVTNFTLETPIMPPFVASRVRKLSSASKSAEVIARFGLRMAAIVAFAVVGGIGFERGLTLMLWMSAILATVVAMFDREELGDTTLNHWDEASAYAALCCLAGAFAPAS
jgi:hypothetical protein